VIADHASLLILSGAIILDLLTGEPPNAIHPVVWMGAYIKNLWARRFSSTPLTLLLSGCLIVVSGVLIFSLPLYFLL
jgi:adenosylcobinamide-phosphate synthase